ncbi:MAG TPA: cupredoxin domain-containing protein [bacterium]|jgi:uncharacterized cupredoxin-like copper-binding protein
MRSRGVLILIVIVALAVAVPAAGAPKVQKVTITMTDFKFTPATVTLQAGVEAEITLINKGKVEHEFMVYPAPKSKVSDWDAYIMPNTYFQNMGEVEGEFEGMGAVAGTSVFEVEVKPGKRAELKFTPTRKGTFEMACHAEGHYEAGMKGVLVVK